MAGFSPDLEPSTQGISTDCTAFIPSLKGMKAASSEQSTSLPALAAACQGASSNQNTDGTLRFFAGTATKLYEAGSSSWTDVSRAVGGAYTTAVDGRWRFSQYGNVALATNLADSLQYSVTSGAFANVTGTPKGAVIDTAVSFVLLGNYNDGSAVPNGIWWSALGDYTSWTPSAATQAGKALITQTPGQITALRALGDNVVVYKNNSMYLGQYQGSPLLWTFSLVSSETGTPCQETVVPITTADGGFVHYFMGSNDFYSYNGALPTRIGTPIREYVFGRINNAYAYKSVAVHDPVNTIIYFFYPSTGATSPDSCVVYNYKSNRWGVDDRSIEFACQYVTGGYTYSTLTSTFVTYSGLPSVSYGSPFWLSTNTVPCIFNTSHLLKTLTGAPGNWSVTLGDVGDDAQFSLLKRVRPRWITRPSSATLTPYYKFDSGDTLTANGSSTMSTGHFDLLQESRWHRVKIDGSGTAEIAKMEYEVVRSSDE